MNSLPWKYFCTISQKKVVLNKITPLTGLHLTQMQSLT